VSAIDDDNDYFQSFCKQLLKRDYFIKSAQLVDNVDYIIAAAYRQGLVSLMTSEESSRAAAQAAIHTATRNTYKSKIGEIQYSTNRYTNFVKARVPIKTATKRIRFLLLLTFLILMQKLIQLF
jgi:hypothetical protein